MITLTLVRPFKYAPRLIRIIFRFFQIENSSTLPYELHNSL